MSKLFVLAMSVAMVLGCKSKEKAPPPPPTEPVAAKDDGGAAMGSAGDQAGSGSASADTFPLNAGETYYGGTVTATNLVSWKVEDGTIVQLGIVTTGKTAGGREEGLLRAYHGTGTNHDVDQRYSLDPAVDHWAELKALPNGRVLFRYGEAGTTAQARNAVLLRWDAEAKRVRVAKRWAGAAKDEEPAWLATGEYKRAAESATEAEALCLEVIARMVKCEKDPKFRTALFTRDASAAKPSMQEHFDTHVVEWKTPAGAKAQCAKWSSDAYVETHFSEPAKLKRLAGETKFDCAFFASEIVDEGGLPVALTDPAPR